MRERRSSQSAMATGSGEGYATNSGPGYVGNEEGGLPDGTPGSSKVAKVGADRGSKGDASSDRASGSAGRAAGGGRAGSDLADVATQLAATQLKVVRRFEARLVRPDERWLQTVDDPDSSSSSRSAPNVGAVKRRGSARGDEPTATGALAALPAEWIVDFIPACYAGHCPLRLSAQV